MKQNEQNHLKTSSWGYAKHPCGPSDWPQKFPTSGTRQSPINIVTYQLDGYDIDSTCCKGQTITTTRPPYHGQRSHLDSQGDELECDPINDNEGRYSPSSSSSSSSALSVRDMSSSSAVSSSANSPVCGEPAWSSGDINKTKEHKDINVIGRNKQLESIYENNNNNDEIYERQNTRHCVSKRKIFIGYPRYLHELQLTNTGHNWQVDIPPEIGVNTLIAGAPFGDREFRLAQFHCHWGASNECGSEHKINGRSYGAEIHFVHWNCSEFSSFDEAASKRHGLAVLAVLVQALDGEQNRNKHLDKICRALDIVKSPKSSTRQKARLDMKKLFPASRWNYATYEGSLTTPPLSEVVDWLVFLKPIQCSTYQLEQFRQLERTPPGPGCQADKLLSNCRPVQPHCGRQVTLWSHH